jgi:protein TonB
MFETATFSYGPSSKRVWTTAMGFTGQAVLIGCALLAPLISPQTLGRAFLVTALVAPGVPPPPLPPGPEVVPVPRHGAVAPTSTHALIAPVAANVPAIAATIIDPPEIGASGTGRTGVYSGFTGGGAGGGPSIIDDVIRMVPVVRPPEVVNREPVRTAAAPVKPPRISVVRLATPIYRVEPIYPRLAREAHVSGVVELLGVLSTDGRIHELKVVRGHPLLVAAALDAVRQWIYEPTLLNGQAVEVAAPITVTFTLNR